MTQSPLSALDATIEWLKDERHWRKGEGDRFSPCLCIKETHARLSQRNWKGRLLGAAAIDDAAQELFPERRKWAPELTAGAAVNDHPDTTHADIMRVACRAREILGERGQ